MGDMNRRKEMSSGYTIGKQRSSRTLPEFLSRQCLWGTLVSFWQALFGYSVWNSNLQHMATLKGCISLHSVLCKLQEIPENSWEYCLGNNHTGITGYPAWFILWQPNEWGQSATGKALLTPMKLEQELIWCWKLIAMCHSFMCKI